MNTSFWKLSLKYHAPATISGFIFFYLSSNLLSNSELIQNYPSQVLLALIVIANFCAYLLYRSTKNKNIEDPTEFEIAKNKINQNETEGSMHIGIKTGKNQRQNINIKNNEITNNKVKGDIVIGSSKET